MEFARNTKNNADMEGNFETSRNERLQWNTKYVIGAIVLVGLMTILIVELFWRRNRFWPEVINCSPSPCVYGQCFEKRNDIWCKCVDGFKGRLCDEPINPDLPVIG